MEATAAAVGATVVAVPCGVNEYSTGLDGASSCTPCPSGFVTDPENEAGSQPLQQCAWRHLGTLSAGRLWHLALLAHSVLSTVVTHDELTKQGFLGLSNHYCFFTIGIVKSRKMHVFFSIGRVSRMKRARSLRCAA
jgi:hypothetical protein